MTIKISSYNESKVNNEENKEEQLEKQKEEKENKKEELKELVNVKFGEEIIHKLLKIKEEVKKGENIELFIDIPPTFEEETIKINSLLKFETISEKKLELETNIILTTIPLSILISCREYKLIKQKTNYDSHIQFEQSFKIDCNEFIANEEINFDLENYNNNDSIEFFLCVKSLNENTSEKPNFLTTKQKNSFRITIPKYNFNSNDTEIPRLNCVIEVNINNNFAIYIIIDSLIRPNINILKMYDYYKKDYVENESCIYLNDISTEIFIKKEKRIKLNFFLFSSMNNIPFEVIPDSFKGGEITKYKGTIKNGKSEFCLELSLNNFSHISYNKCVTISVSLENLKIEFKIKFIKPSNNVFSKDYYNHFGIKGKNKITENWSILNDKMNKINFYVTPFNSKMEISLNELKNGYSYKGLTFLNINNNGEILNYNTYHKEYKKGYLKNILFFNSNIPFCIQYNNIWYPIIKNNGKLNNWKSVYFSNYEDIKKEVCDNFINWENKMKKNKDVYFEIIKLDEYNEFKKSYNFYKKCETTINDNIIYQLQNFKNQVNDFKKEIKNEKINFECIAYHLLNNTKITLPELHKNLPSPIKEVLQHDYNYYKSYKSNQNDKDLALYNYIIKLNEIFIQKEEEFEQNNSKIIIECPDIENEQENLLLFLY